MKSTIFIFVKIWRIVVLFLIILVHLICHFELIIQHLNSRSVFLAKVYSSYLCLINSEYYVHANVCACVHAYEFICSMERIVGPLGASCCFSQGPQESAFLCGDLSKISHYTSNSNLILYIFSEAIVLEEWKCHKHYLDRVVSQPLGILKSLEKTVFEFHEQVLLN